MLVHLTRLKGFVPHGVFLLVENSVEERKMSIFRKKETELMRCRTFRSKVQK